MENLVLSGEDNVSSMTVEVAHTDVQPTLRCESEITSEQTMCVDIPAGLDSAVYHVEEGSNSDDPVVCFHCRAYTASGKLVGGVWIKPKSSSLVGSFVMSVLKRALRKRATR